jgi:hypothetical protein
MDGRRFDALTRAVTERGSRRRLFTRLLAGTGLLAGLASGRFVEPASARERDDRTCRNRPAIDNDRCREASICRVRTDQLCACARTVGGAKKCVDITGMPCPTKDECDRSSDCPGDQLCIEIGACCGSSRSRAASSSASTVSAPLLGRP